MIHPIPFNRVYVLKVQTSLKALFKYLWIYQKTPNAVWKINGRFEGELCKR